MRSSLSVLVRSWATALLAAVLAGLLPGMPPAAAASAASSRTMVESVSAGAGHTCAIRSDGTIACWGGNWSGQATPPEGTFTAVSAGNSHTCAVHTDGTLACWGDNDYGSATPPDGTYTAVSAGGYHSCAIRTDGTLECWGFNGWGRATSPEGTFTAVSAGGDHSCAIRTDGTLACWGYNEAGQASPPRGTYTAVSAGGWHSCAIRTDGALRCWGANYIGQSSPLAGTFLAVAAGGWHSCAIASDQTVTCWGENDYGEGDAPSGTFTQLDAGLENVCAVTTEETVACWGDNSEGQSVPSPAAEMTPLGRWSTATSLPLAWSARPGLDPVASYDVSFRRARWNAGFGDPVAWLSETADTSGAFHPVPGSSYCFSALARDGAGLESNWTYPTCTAAPLDDRSLVRRGNWAARTDAAYYQGSYLRTSSRGATLTRTGVRANRLAIVATTCPSCGTIRVYWGRTLLREISLRSDTTVVGKVIQVKRWWGTHDGTLKIKVVSSGKKVKIDGVGIYRQLGSW